MAVKEIKDVAASVLARLKKQSHETGLSYQICLQLFAQEEFLRKLGRSKYYQNLILKGGMFLYTLTEFEGRPTMDIDFMLQRLSNDLKNIEKVMNEICKIDTGNDYIVTEVLSTEKILSEKEYPGVKTKFLTKIKNIRIPFSIDIGVDDVIVPGPIERNVVTRLDGFDHPTILTYSLESTIAEKFEAILKRMSATSRMKDFFDLYYLSKMFEYDGEKLYKAIFQTLHHRGTFFEKGSFSQIKEFINNNDIVHMWNKYNPGSMLDKPTLTEVINQMTAFIEPVFEAIVNNKSFNKHWYPNQNKWEC